MSKNCCSSTFAFIADSLSRLVFSGKTLMASGSTSASKVVGHSYGAEAESVARSFGTSVEREWLRRVLLCASS